MKRTLASVWPRIRNAGELRSTFVLSRFALASFTFVTSFYCLLFYVPFSRHTLFDWHVVSALAVLARYHALLYWIVLLPVCLTLVPTLRQPSIRRPTIAFLVVALTAGISISIRPLLPNLPPDERSLIWSLVSLFPMCWVALLDWRAGNRSERSTQSERRLNFADVAGIAGCVSILYLGVFAIRYLPARAASFTRLELLFFIVCSFAWHLALFALVFSAFQFVNAVSAKISRSSRLGLILRSGLVAIALAMVLRKVVFAAFSFNDRAADFSAVALSCAFAAFFAGALIRFRDFARESRRVSSPLAGFLTAPIYRWVAGISSAGVTLAFAYLTLVNLQGVDWNGLLQKISVLLVWVTTFVVWRAWRQDSRRAYSLTRASIVFFGSLALYFAVQTARPALTRLMDRKTPAASLLVERYADYDPSFGMAREILAPATVDAFEGNAGDPFFAMLRENSNIRPEIKVDPAEIKLVDKLEPTQLHKPHLFIFVIDSLRQDYLSPYNKSVHFTPAIDTFAAESVVMKNAFTRYGGTALAEPSIWTGGMELHKQFVQPFYPMNSLQKLLDVDRYQALITLDPILKAILKPSANILELDQNVDWKNYDLVQTLAELQNRLAAMPKQQSLFVYSQPQNIHLVSLKGNTRQPSDSANYEGFEKQHAFEVERMDKAFGEFVQFLKSSGLYDDSIIVLTADHGDSLGEEGHWGHGNSIYPEVIRIPLIIHLPPAMKNSLIWDPNSVAFSTDITPTLYYLLGHRPVNNNQLTGRPLFAETMAEQDVYKRDSYLIVDSYGPVYGLLRNNGQSLFVADAGKNRAYLYDLTRGYSGRRIGMTEESNAECRKLISSDVQSIQAFYRFHPEQEQAVSNSQSSTLAQLYSLLFSK